MGTFRRINGLCALVFVLLAAATAQQCSSSLKGSLLLAKQGSIVRIDGSGQNEEVVVGSVGQALSLDYDQQRSVLYWSDLVTSEIYSIEEKSSKLRRVASKQPSWMPFSLALEPVTGKLYAGDGFSGTVRIYDLKRDDEKHAVVVAGERGEVRCVAVDANAGYLFVLHKYQLLRTDLDGANRKVLLQAENNEPLSVFRILVDQEAQRLYWLDSLARQIESVNYAGQERRVHFHEPQGRPIPESFGSLALLDGYLYWSDAENSKIFKIDATTGESSDVLDISAIFVKAITCPSQKPIDDPCADNNGGCEQFCLLSKSSRENYRCACSVGYELAEDQKSCVVIS